MFVAVVHPQIEVKTSDAREILRKEVLLKDAIKQWGNIAGLVAGFMKNDYGLISRSLEDVIIEPVRSMLIPGFDDVKKKSVDAGALGGGISGSGPSIFMLCEEKSTAMSVEKIMKDIYDNTGLKYHTYVTTINNEGKIINQYSPTNAGRDSHLMVTRELLRSGNFTMRYFSTNNNSPKVDFKEATIKGQAPDKGLYFPEIIPVLNKEFIE